VEIAALCGIQVRDETKILIGEVDSVEESEPFAKEKLSPILAMYKAKDFDDALYKADTLVRGGGFGHTAAIYIDEEREKERLSAFNERMKTCRILVNTPAAQGGIGDLYNFRLTPSLTLGCGSWGGNSVCENVGISELLNIKTVAERRENMLWFRAPEKVYFKRGCLSTALKEIKEVYGKSRAFLCLLQQFQNIFLGFVADGGDHFFTILQNDDGGNTDDPELTGQLHFFIHVDLAHDDVAAFCGDFFDDGSDHLTGAAPGCPEIHQHRLFVLIDDGIKVIFGNMDKGHG
jgi:hypothetical protein